MNFPLILIVTNKEEELQSQEGSGNMVWVSDSTGTEIRVRQGHEEDIESYSHEFSEIMLHKITEDWDEIDSDTDFILHEIQEDSETHNNQWFNELEESTKLKGKMFNKN